MMQRRVPCRPVKAVLAGQRQSSALEQNPQGPPENFPHKLLDKWLPLLYIGIRIILNYGDVV